MTLLSREAILAAKAPYREINVPELGGKVRVRGLSVKSRVKLLDAIYDNEIAHTSWKQDQAKPEGERDGVARVDLYDQAVLTVLVGIVDANGEQMFDFDDYEWFASFDYDVIAAIWSAMNNLQKRDPEAVKKNSA